MAGPPQSSVQSPQNTEPPTREGTKGTLRLLQDRDVTAKDTGPSYKQRKQKTGHTTRLLSTVRRGHHQTASLMRHPNPAKVTQD